MSPLHVVRSPKYWTGIVHTLRLSFTAMERAAFELKSLALIALLGYVLTFLLGTAGSMLEANSYGQLLL